MIGTWILGIVGVVAGVYLLDLWLYRLKERPKELGRRGQGSAAAPALLTLQTFFDPSAQGALEARLEESVEEDESGDPPEAGADRS